MLGKPLDYGNIAIDHMEKTESRDPVVNREPSRDDPVRADPETGADTPKQSKKIGWIQFTVLLIVEAIALGTLGMASAFAALGMALGIAMTLFFGLISIYMAYIIGQVKLNDKEIRSFPDLGRSLFGNLGYWIVSTMFVSTLTLLVGGHVLAGTQAFNVFFNHSVACAVWWSVVAAFMLFVLALPKHFKDFAILAYIDFGSIIVAVGVIIIAAGIIANKADGLESVQWSWGPPTGQRLYTHVLAAMTIIFAFSFTMVQPAMMNEMRVEKDYMKAVWALGVTEIIIYTVVGAVSYSLIGQDVASPMLLSSSPIVVCVAFGMALPVIFISGSINTIVVGKFIQETSISTKLHIFPAQKRWARPASWVLLVFIITLIAWMVAEAIPFFSDLLGLIASLFISGFSFYIPAWLWFKKLKVGRWNASWKNIALSLVNATIIIIGLVVLGLGAYASIKDILVNYATGTVKVPFSCKTAY